MFENRAQLRECAGDRRKIRTGRGHDGARELRGELLAELHAPLIERVHVPDHALHVDLVLVERDELAERCASSCSKSNSELGRLPA